MFQKKIDELFSSMANAFGIANDIFIAGFDGEGKDDDETLEKVLQMCRQANLKQNKDKCHFMCSSIPFFGKLISQQCVSQEPRKVQALKDMPPTKSKIKKELQLFLGIINYLSKFSWATAEVCKPLQKLTSVKADWTWNGMYQDLHDRAKKIVKKDVCMKFYKASRTLYLETDASDVDLGARLLQVRDGTNCRCDKMPDSATLFHIAFTSKSMLSAEWCYSNIEHKALGISHGLEKLSITALQEKYVLSLTMSC